MVVAIIAVLAGLLVPSLSGSGGRSVERAGREMAELINRARQEAALEARPWCVVLRPAEGAYSFRRRVGGECRSVEDQLFRERRLPGGLEWQSATVNGEPLRGAGRALLFPTGEQETLEVVIATTEGPTQRRVRLGPVGRARLVGRD